MYLGVLAATAAGLAIAALGPWRKGVVVIGIAALVAAATRLVLSNDDGGMLRVRTKAFDVTLLVGAGVLLILLASVIPNHTVA